MYVLIRKITSKLAAQEINLFHAASEIPQCLAMFFLENEVGVSEFSGDVIGAQNPEKGIKRDLPVNKLTEAPGTTAADVLKFFKVSRTYLSLSTETNAEASRSALPSVSGGQYGFGRVTSLCHSRHMS